MAGTVTIKDGTTVKYKFPVVTNFDHNYEKVINQYEAEGILNPPLNDTKTVIHVITVDFDLVDKGTYDPGQDPGSTGSIWKQQSLLQQLKNQSTANYYTLIEDDDTENTTGYYGLIKKIIINRKQPSQLKKTGSLLFIESDDIMKL
ncbi:MAG: hypothetical protein AB1467_06835 [Candidatus Diapherotrites archaeon]